jgi:hypothetical protein
MSDVRIIETENSFYTLYYNEEKNKFIVQRIASKRLPVSILCEPLYVGENMFFENNSLVIKECGRIILRTTKILKIYIEPSAIY